MLMICIGSIEPMGGRPRESGADADTREQAAMSSGSEAGDEAVQ